MLPPQLVSEYSSQNSKPVAELTPGSTFLALWECNKGHMWEAKVFSRKHHGCPYCSGRKILTGFNDFATQHPTIAAEWDYNKNTLLNPTQLSSSSNEKVWWKCNLGHEWETKISSRTAKLSKCRTCSRNTGNKTKNAITHYPHLATYVTSPTVLNVLAKTPPETDTTFPWVCNVCSHKWEESLRTISKREKVCPACADVQKIISQQNAMARRVNVKWDEERNSTVLTLPVNKESHWWQCTKCSHSWKSTFTAIFYQNERCSKCEHIPLSQSHPNLLSQWGNKNSLSPDEVTAGSGKKVWWQCEKGHEWETPVYSRARNVDPSGCPECNISRGVSLMEQQLFNYVKDLVPELTVYSNYKKLIRGELDIYIPERKIAIEFNGLYWHSENQGKDKWYHHNKWQACQEEGVQLIQIWEDSWKENPELVKTLLAHKLGASKQPKIYARKTQIKVLTKTETEIFLNNNHIQGKSTLPSILIGLTYNNETVAVMLLKYEPGSNQKTLNLLRYSTSSQVVGGFTKLLKYVEKVHSPDSIISFSDNCVSDGSLYVENGFVNAKVLSPDYMYVVKGQRRHKFNYRLKKFKTDPDLNYEEGLTERELAELNNLPRIWDAGKIKWVKNLTA